ncbi:MAG: cytidine deaminase [Agathobacter sp.]|nr:cytidine deaminase [Agathobacter sp.]MBQ3559807.1 cytidine deaminase [Agathobacter sp.]
MDRYEELIDMALDARKLAYAPYSKFKVGAALLGKNGVVYMGCNVENASYPATNCAERTAFFSAVSEGQREFEAIAIVGGKDTISELEYCAPCGVCRQVMREFCDPKSFEIILAKNRTEYKVYTLEELLPMGFGPENLG